MKTNFNCITMLIIFLFPYILIAGEIDDKTVVVSQKPKVWQTFPMRSVRLLPGSPFYHAMKVSQQYLVDMDIERMLNDTRIRVGLPAKSDYSGSNQPKGTRPGDLPHYISGISLMYAQTGDQEYLKRVNYLIDELILLDEKTDSLLTAKGEKETYPFDKLLNGELLLSKPDDAGYPWGGTTGNMFYGIHKLYAAYRDAYLYCDNKKALQLWIKKAEPVTQFVLKVNPDLFDGFLDLEHGGMNAVFADLYALTGDKRYLDVSLKFNHQKVILNIADNKDVLYGRHANFQIPTFEGTSRQYQLTGNEVSGNATKNFLDMVYSGHTNCIGGNSCYERFGNPGETTKRFGYTSSETCNTYNMLKVALNTFESTGNLKHMEYFERALYNHILASQDPNSGGVTYYVSTIPGGFKSYSDRFNLDGVWCCVGTGMENHSKYVEGIYFNNHQSLYINLFIPSTLDWKEKGLKIRQETTFPEQDKISFKIVENHGYDKPIYVRYPTWVESSAQIWINGNPVRITANPGEYICLNYNWKTGDKVDIEFPQTFHLEAAHDDPFMNSILKGPIVYAAELGTENMPKDLVRNAGDNSSFLPLNDIPTIIADKVDIASWLALTEKSMEYQTQNVGYLQKKTKDVKIAPFYKLHHQRYSLYLKIYSPEEIELRNKVVLDELRPSYPVDESTHNFNGEKTNLTFQDGHSPAFGYNTWEKTRFGRNAISGGWFSYEMKVNNNIERNFLVVTYWGNEAKDHIFNVLVDGVKIASEDLFDKNPVTFYEVTYELPKDLIKGKDKVTIRFEADPGKNAGTVFGLKTTTDPRKFPNYYFYF